MLTEYKLSEYITEYEKNINLYKLILEKYPDAIYNSFHGKFISEKVNSNFSNHYFFIDRFDLYLQLYNIENFKILTILDYKYLLNLNQLII